MLYQSPELLQQLLAILTQAVISYLNAQIAAGVQVVMLFDTWGGLLTTPAYRQFSLAYMQQIQQAIYDQHQGNIPCIMFTKGGSEWLELMADSGCQAVGIDWTITIDRAKARLGNKVALQGNMDPAMLYAEPAKIRQEVQTLLAQYGHAHGHIFNLGHGLYPDIPPDHVGCLVDAVHEFSPIYHQN